MWTRSPASRSRTTRSGWRTRSSRDLKKTGALSKSAFVLGTKAKDANDRILYDKKTGYISYDADGAGKGAAIKIAKIADKVSLTHADFFVI